MENQKDKYASRGVSSQKEDVHKAVSKLDKGLFKHSFCQIFPSPESNDQCIVLHADGAGTKSSLAYAYWRETGDLSVWQDIATDALVMNTDDMMCVGLTDQFYISGTIGRNKNLVPAEVLEAIIEGNVRFAEKMKKYDIDLVFTGGETADVGDLVRTIVVDATALGFIPKAGVISNEEISDGDVIVGFASFGQAPWEDRYNSGIGSNGLTSARHDIFSKKVMHKYPETFDSHISEEFVYNGAYFLTDQSPVNGIDMGHYVLSPTRTFLPVVKEIFRYYRGQVHGMIHCTGGAQTKVKKYINNLNVVKDNLFPTPELFRLIQASAKTDWCEMYSVFNMGHRLEMYLPEKMAGELVKISTDMGVDAKIVGYVKSHQGERVELHTENGIFTY